MSFYTASSSVTSGLFRSNRLVLEPSTSGYGGLGISSSERVPLWEMASAATNTSYQLVLVLLWMCLGDAPQEWKKASFARILRTTIF